MMLFYPIYNKVLLHKISERISKPVPQKMYVDEIKRGPPASARLKCMQGKSIKILASLFCDRSNLEKFNGLRLGNYIFTMFILKLAFQICLLCPFYMYIDDAWFMP